MSPVLTTILGQVKPPSPSTTVPNPVQGPIDDLTNLAGSCKDNPSWICTHVKDLTGSDFWAGAADWFVQRPLTVLLIALLAWITNRVVRRLIKRSTERMLEPSKRSTVRWLRDKSPSALLRTEAVSLRTEARVHTLSSVFRGIASTIIWFIAICWILGVLEVNLGPVLATVSIAGVALGFGAQYLVRDFLSGIFMVVEDQFGVGDIVDLGEAKGVVEKITLRATRVRDVNGVVWHVPNGQVTRVANKSQEWARAVLDLEVGYDCDVERAQEVIQATAEALAADEEWMADIIDSPEVWGIENFTEKGVAIRLVIKTQPASQFGVMRELRGRLKVALEQNDITFAAAQGDLYVHLADDGAAREEGALTTSTPPPPPDLDATAQIPKPKGRPPRGDPSETD